MAYPGNPAVGSNYQAPQFAPQPTQYTQQQHPQFPTAQPMLASDAYGTELGQYDAAAQPGYPQQPQQQQQQQPQHGHHHHHHMHAQPQVQLYGGQAHMQVPTRTGGMMDVSVPTSPTAKAEMTKEMKELLEVVGTSAYPIQALKNFSYLMSQGYAVVVGSLLAVFVPQQCCAETADNICTAETLGSAYLCSMEDQFTGLTKYNQFVLGWNFITLFAMAAYFCILWSRENFILKYFVEDPEESEIHIRSQWTKYPELQWYMTQHNKVSFFMCCLGLSIQFVNIIVSAVLLFGDYYAGSKTAIGYVSNILVQGGFAIKATEIAYQDWKHNLSRTILAVEPISYNKVNPKYINA